MKHSKAHRICNTTVNENLSVKRDTVKHSPRRKYGLFLLVYAACAAMPAGASLNAAARPEATASSSGASSAVNDALNHAKSGRSASLLSETGPNQARERAMLNAQHLSVMIRSVVPERQGVMIENIATGKVKRYAPEQPVWILDVPTGPILYYQGQKSFVGQSASQLVDDSGQRFGQKALGDGKSPHDMWLALDLGGQTYPAYCSAHATTVVCSLGVSRNSSGSARPQRPELALSRQNTNLLIY
jgi:hypothetical protein